MVPLLILISMNLRGFRPSSPSSQGWITDLLLFAVGGAPRKPKVRPTRHSCHISSGIRGRNPFDSSIARGTVSKIWSQLVIGTSCV